MVTPETLYLSFNFSNRLFTPGSALEFERHHFGPGMVLFFFELCKFFVIFSIILSGDGVFLSPQKNASKCILYIVYII